jgi:hypothetical protein
VLGLLYLGFLASNHEIKVVIRNFLYHENEREIHESEHGILTLRLGDTWATKIILEPCSSLLPCEKRGIGASHEFLAKII